MSRSDALLAARQERPSVMDLEAVTVTDRARCSPQYAPSVARTLKYRLSLGKADQYTVVTATIKPE